MKKIIILCTGNSCRSQMAEGWIRKLTDHSLIIHSAGTNPEPVNPSAIKVMQMASIDISKHKSNHIDDYVNIHFDYVITVCDNACKISSNLYIKGKAIHRSFPDPAKAKGTQKQIDLVYLKVRDMIEEFAKEFVFDELGFID